MAVQANVYLDKLAEGKAVLAPMAGYTDAPFRKLCRAFGSAWAVTEMVSAKALVTGNLRGITIGEPYPGEPDLVIQVFGAEPEMVAAGGRILYEHYRPVALDLNMGCPVKKVTGRSCGSKLMLEPERAAAIIAALRAAVPVPVSAKMRLGYDRVNVLEVALALEQAGASLLAIHGRTAQQKYSGEADWQAIAEVATRLHIPVVGSGDVRSRAQYVRYTRQGLGVMVARASVGRPWVFAELRGERPPSHDSQLQLAYYHARLHCAWYGEARGMRSFRGQLLRYIEACSDADSFANVRPMLNRVSSLADLADILRQTFGLEPALQPMPDWPAALQQQESDFQRLAVT